MNLRTTFELHQQILDHLRRDDWEAARYGLRRYLMLWAPTEAGRADALTVTAFACLRAGRVDEAIDFAKQALSIVTDHRLALATLKEAIAMSATSLQAVV